MGRLVLTSLAACIVMSTAWAQPESRTVLGGRNELVAAGADAIRAGRYDEGIRLTRLGLQRESSPFIRAAGLANLCAAHAAVGDPRAALADCTASLALNARNWRAYSNRAYAHLLDGAVADAIADIEAAAAIAPDAPQVRQIREMINEKRLVPQISMEELP